MAKVINCDGKVQEVDNISELVKDIPEKKPKKNPSPPPAEDPLRFRYLWLLIVLLVLIAAGVVYYLV